MSDLVYFNYSTTKEFRTKNSPYELHFNPGIYKIILYGAAGGYTTFGKENQPGKGGMVSGFLNLEKYTKLYLYVGGQGTNTSSGDAGEGGYNGGVDGGTDYGSGDCGSAGSGGATDLRIEGGDWNNSVGLRSRIMIAGGGGSPGCYSYAGKGGDGGGLEGIQGGNTTSSSASYGKIVEGGLPGTQKNGSHFGYGEKGEDGEESLRSEAGGSGGGGYWGGFGGSNSINNTASGSGGGGGSSFISGHPGCYAIDINGNPTDSNIHYSKIRFYNTKMETGVNLDDGKAIIIGILPKIYNTCSVPKEYHISILLFILLIKI